MILGQKKNCDEYIQFECRVVFIHIPDIIYQLLQIKTRNKIYQMSAPTPNLTLHNTS